MKEVWCGITIIVLFFALIGIDALFCVELGAMMLLIFVVKRYLDERDKMFRAVITYIGSTLLCIFVACKTADFSVLIVYILLSIIILLRFMIKQK